MNYPSIIERRAVGISSGWPNIIYAGIECTIAMSPVREMKVRIDNMLLGMTDENEADVFIEEALRLDRSGTGYGSVALA